MAHNYTPNKLVKFIYGETDLFETLEIENTLENDAELRAMFYNLKNGYQKLPNVKFAPSQSSIDNILLFSSISKEDALAQ